MARPRSNMRAAYPTASSAVMGAPTTLLMVASDAVAGRVLRSGVV